MSRYAATSPADLVRRLRQYGRGDRRRMAHGRDRPWRRHRHSPERQACRGRRIRHGVRRSRAAAQLVVLAFKPQKLDEVAPALRQFLSAKTVIVSLLAGVEAESLRLRFPGVAAIVRAMPNLPVAVRRGVTGLYSPDADERDPRATQQPVHGAGLRDVDGGRSEARRARSVAGAGRPMSPASSPRWPRQARSAD